jgi:hypothetical protein
MRATAGWSNAYEHFQRRAATITQFRCHFPASPFRYFSWASQIVRSVSLGQSCLLWITEFGIWPSSENWSLFDRLRRSYGESASLQERPGHLFSSSEIDDLTTILQLSALFGWGGYLLSEANSVNCFFSHDEFIEFFAHERRQIEKLRDRLAT